MKWSTTIQLGMTFICLSEGDWDCEIIPDLGGKVSSIRWRGHELLAANPRKPLRPAQYAAGYAEYDASGFDECFPSIGFCIYPEHPWLGTEIPDHGELWSIPWSSDFQSDALQLFTHGIRLPYSFSKTISFTPNGEIQFHYEIKNHTPFPLKYLWSAHPLFAPQPCMRILLPAKTTVCVDWSKDNRLGEIGLEHEWPITRDKTGSEVDLSLVLESKTGFCEKVYTSPLAQGWCALFDPTDGRYAAFTFSTKKVPYVGLSINLGGWPVDEPGYYNLGLEPCNGYPDRLDLAIKNETCSVLAENATEEWDIYLHAGKSSSEADVRESLARQSSICEENQAHLSQQDIGAAH